MSISNLFSNNSFGLKCSDIEVSTLTERSGQYSVVLKASTLTANRVVELPDSNIVLGNGGTVIYDQSLNTNDDVRFLSVETPTLKLSNGSDVIITTPPILSNVSLNLPTTTGTIALTSDIPTPPDQSLNTSDAVKFLSVETATLKPSVSNSLTLPNTTDTVVVLSASQTLTNKTLTSPTISTIINTGTLTLPTTTGTIALTSQIPTTIPGLSDVQLSAISGTGLYYGQSLSYNTTTSKWSSGDLVPQWIDLLGIPSERASGATKPPINQYDVAGVFFEHSFNAGTTIFYFTYHIPHSYILNSNMFLHAHISTKSATETGNMILEVAATYASSGDVFPAFITLANITKTFAGASDQYRHYIIEIPLSTVGGSSSTLNSSSIDTDGLIFVRLQRTADTIVTPGSLFLHQLDIHMLSLPNQGTINRVAPFRV